MGKIILNGTEYGGNGGSGGHTIVDPTGTDMPQENKLQFTGNVSVSDDSANGQTVVDIGGSGGNVYGAFIDPTRVVYSSFVFDSSAHTWTATEDCILTDNMLPPDSTMAYFIRIGGKQVFAGYSTVEDPFVYVKKGQVVEYRAKSGSSLKAYGVTQGTSGIYAPVIYSDTERVIGVWRDNKPLYQKSINIGAVASNNVKIIDITNLNVDYVADYIATAVLTNGWKVPLPQTHTSSFGYQAFCRLSSSTQLAVGVGSNVGISDGYVTLQYTKTTDVAGSGDWTPSGVPSVHYSTNEQVIGTWIDGKPLYERTFDLTSGITIGGYTDIAIDTTTNKIKNLDGYIERSNGAVDKINGYIQSDDTARMAVRTGKIEVYISNVFTGVSELWVTIQYTKTTD